MWLSREKAQHPLYFQTLGCLTWLQEATACQALGSLSCVIALSVTVAFTMVRASDYFSVSSCFLSTLCPSEAHPPPFQIVVAVVANYDTVE